MTLFFAAVRWLRISVALSFFVIVCHLSSQPLGIAVAETTKLENDGDRPVPFASVDGHFVNNRTPIFSIQRVVPHEPNEPGRNLRQPSSRRLAEEAKETKRLAVSNAFQPLACNGYQLSKLTTAQCQPWSSMKFNTTTEQVIIPCGICVTMAEYTKGEILVLEKGINVEGRWHFPSVARVVIQTPHVLVQGKLTITSEDMILGPGKEHVKFILTGNEDQLFAPHSQNSYLCGGEGFACNVGPRAVVVAGGQVDIVGMKNGCPSWIRLGDAKPVEGNPGAYRYTLDPNVLTSSWQLPGGMCHNLAGNLFWSYGRQQTLTYKEDPAGSGPYYSITGRDALWSSLSWNINPHCAVPGHTYAFKCKVRVLSNTPQGMTVNVKIYRQDRATVHTVRLRDCPSSSAVIGWVECSGDVTFDHRFSNADKLEVIFITASDKTSEVNYKDISFIYKSNAVEATMTLAKAVERCWSTGVEVALTSQTINSEESQVQKIVQNSAVSGLQFTGKHTQLLTKATAREQAAEVILLNRNIVFQTEEGAPAKKGGHFMVLNTPGVAQRIEGVAFVGFGQDGIMGRYPINFHMCGGDYGTLISKNLIRNSNNRCVVLDGTNDVVLSYNAAYNTVGHCYTLEDGSEMGNIFESNIGALTRAATTFTEAERDNAPATFFITNPQNVFRGNVAAGSNDSGFMFLFYRSVVGDSEPFYPELNPQTLPFRTFENNIAHSNRVAGFKMAMIFPEQRSILKGIKAFRNRNYGIYLFSVNNLELSDAYIADNLYGVDLNMADNVAISKSVIQGVSDGYKSYVAASNSPQNSFCREGMPHQIGLHLHPVLNERTSVGPIVSRVQFVNYGSQKGCPGSVSIELSNDIRDVIFEPRIHFEAMTFVSVAGINGKFSLCSGLEKGVKGVHINDDGSLNPSGTGKPGYILSAEAIIPKLSTNSICSPMGEGTCAKYCTGECLRTVKISLSPNDTEGSRVVVIDVSNPDTQVELEGVFRPANEQEQNLWVKRRIFEVALPNKRFQVKILDKSGQPMFPRIAEAIYGTPPNCQTYLTAIEFFVPAIQPGQCQELVEDGSFQKGSSSLKSWYHSGSGLRLEEFKDFGYALATLPRATFLHGPVVFIDTRCIAHAGDIIELVAKVRLVERQQPSNLAICDPSSPHTAMRCPSANVIVKRGGLQTEAFWDFAQVRQTWNATGWNIISGNVEVSEAMVSAESLAILITRVRKEVRIVLQDVSIKVHRGSCKDIIRNGNFASNSMAGWSLMGETVKPIVTNGVLYISGREKWYYGIAQALSQSCLIEGGQYEVHAKVQLVGGEGLLTCDPGRLYMSSESCPNMNLRIQDESGKEIFMEIGRTVGPYKTGEWNTMYGIFTATKEMVGAKRVMFYINRSPENVNMALTGIMILPVTEKSFGLRDCNQLVRNADASHNNAAFWAVNGIGSFIKISQIGEKSYFHYVQRSQWFHSIFQDIDKSCLIPGTMWRLEASIQLFDNASGEAYHCEKKCETPKCLADIGRCPWFQLTLERPGKKDSITLWDDNPIPWKKDEFNTVYYNNFNAKENLLDYENIYVAIIGPKEGVDMMIDYVKFSKISMPREK